MQGDYGVGLGFTRYPAVAKSTGPGQVWFGFVGKGKGKGWSKKKGDLLGHVEDNVLKYIRCKETMGLGWVSLPIRLSPKVLALSRFGLLWLGKGNGKGGQREREKMPKYATKPSKNR